MTSSYEDKIYKLREAEDRNAASDPLQWMNLAGLFWLEEGENTFGRDAANKISLPTFPDAVCGYFLLKKRKVTLHPAEGVKLAFDGKAPGSRRLRSDADNKADFIHVGRLTMKIIIRGAATLVRIWDRESPVQKQFRGFKYYPVDQAYRVTAKYVRHVPPLKIKRLDIIGTETDGIFPGQVQFKLNGESCTLEAEKSGDKLLFHFTDGTSKSTTYGGGRKFEVPVPKGDELILDFNLAENWPCAYTHFATCPVVPQKNRLSIKIEAGEKKYFD